MQESHHSSKIFLTSQNTGWYVTLKVKWYSPLKNYLFELAIESWPEWDLNPQAIRPWAQFTLRANFAQLLQKLRNKKQKLAEKYRWNLNIKSFSNETLNFFFGKFCSSYLLHLFKTLWVLLILSQKSTRNFEMKELWTMYWWICSSHFTEVT